MNRRHEKPLRRVNPSGKTVWVARFTKRNGSRASAGTFALKRDAQEAIDAAYDREYADGPRQVGTVEAYVEHWQRLHPRSQSTTRIYASNLRIALDIPVGRRPLRQWQVSDVERSEIAELLDYLLRVDGRAANGARNVLQTLSTMWEDAISDGWTRHNPVAGLRLRSSDPRVQKPRREPRVYSFEAMHALADAAATAQAQAMIRVLSDTGMRIGEMLALERADIDSDWIWIRRTALKGHVTAGTKTTRDTPEKARKCPLAASLAALLAGLPPRLDTRLVFPARNGKPIQNNEFYRWWGKAAEAVGMSDAKPHDFRHSYVSLMRAAGVDPAHLAAWTGHTVETATGTYTHAVGDVSAMAREALG